MVSSRHRSAGRRVLILSTAVGRSRAPPAWVLERLCERTGRADSRFRTPTATSCSEAAEEAGRLAAMNGERPDDRSVVGERDGKREAIALHRAVVAGRMAVL